MNEEATIIIIEILLFPLVLIILYGFVCLIEKIRCKHIPSFNEVINKRTAAFMLVLYLMGILLRILQVMYLTQ